jgi:hypothetical protein
MQAQQVFEVEKVVTHRVIKGSHSFKVKWKGYVLVIVDESW